MSWKVEAEKWLNQEELEETLKQQLELEKNNEKLMEDSFYRNLSFGTAGLRGELGFGTNRMNIYTVRKAAQGLAAYIKGCGDEAAQRGVVIAYDSRHQSPEFGLEVAKVLGNNGIRSYLFSKLQPTPLLSFAVRELNTFSGVVITASHNPAEYNGFKVYGEDGGQVALEAANEITGHVESIEDLFSVEVKDESLLADEGLLTYLGDDLSERYIDQLHNILIEGNYDKNLSIVYSPLHGAGGELVCKGLEAAGFENVTVVAEQANPDPDFSTVEYPNPEESKAFDLALPYGRKVNADILIATDPDADRMGLAVLNKDGDYVFLTGNQIGALLLSTLLEDMKSQNSLPDNGVVIKSIVTSELGQAIADRYDVKMMNVLTGFKFISEEIEKFHKTKESTFLFGYEESFGYLIGDFVRDKDAVQASVLIAEAAARYKEKGLTLLDGLDALYDEFGYYQEALESLTLKGKSGMAEIEKIMTYFGTTKFLNEFPQTIAVSEDYSTGEVVHHETGTTHQLDLPKSNVLKFITADNSWFCIRPSGTEPKIKFYFGVKGETKAKSDTLIIDLRDAVMQVVKTLTTE
ncbi:phospho-sugar mutase [Sporosarcina jiandibaonis]|uniref:phospho-sugar mutase n=1 Tax=Sporosarcina jiandibaonis TaxID=2715535 RepID=UPI001555820B